MTKPKTRIYSRQTRQALDAIGQQIRLARQEREITIAELAERAGISRGLVGRIERGDAGCAVGIVLEAATIVGLGMSDMFGARQPSRPVRERVRRPARSVDDDF